MRKGGAPTTGARANEFEERSIMGDKRGISARFDGVENSPKSNEVNFLTEKKNDSRSEKEVSTNEEENLKLRRRN